MNKSFLCALLLLGLSSCRNGQTATTSNETTAEQTDTVKVNVPLFNQDSAFAYVEHQCSFGPRVPNTKAHEACLAYLKSEMERFGAKVTLQKCDLKAFDGTFLKSTNIISSYFPERNKRVALFGHWDCRPFSDADKSGRMNAPVMGANDAASDVAVLMEVARNLQTNDPGVGVDIIFFDSEDYGAPHNQEKDDDDDTWCLGTQYWGKNTGYTEANKPFVGVLLDMVGAPGAQFAIDAVSRYYAPGPSADFWNLANSMGFGSSFVQGGEAQIVDDHYYVNKIAGIPTFDVIDYRMNEGFPEMWHTQHDDVAHINKNTMGMVGRVLMHYLYENCAK